MSISATTKNRALATPGQGVSEATTWIDMNSVDKTKIWDFLK